MSVAAIINVSAVVLYLAATLVLFGRLRQPPSPGRPVFFLLTLAGWGLYSWICYDALLVEGQLVLSFMNSALLMSWVIVLLFLLAAVARSVDSLGVLILPIGALVLAIATVAPGEAYPAVAISWTLGSHLMIAFLAYALLSLAMAQALLLAFQEYHLRHKRSAYLLRVFPPMQTMEHLLFQLITLGFVLLTLTLVSGTVFSNQVFGKPFAFTHHIVLSSIAWLVFALLLIGHWRLGWRGRNAVRWTLSGFALLALAYFGSKFVLEVVLGR